MSLDFENSIDAISDLNLWFKLRNNESLTLADVPEIIRLRWNYFRDSWEFVKGTYTSAIQAYNDPDKFKNQIDTFSEFIVTQRVSSILKNPFDDNEVLLKFYTIFDNTITNNITLTREETTIISEKTNRVASFTRGNFLKIRLTLTEERDSLSDKTNTSDPDYNRIFDRSPQVGRVRIRNKDLNKMLQLQEAIRSVDFILANSFSLSTVSIDPFAIARQNANNKDIDIGTYSSGVLIKLNYGEDLQALAQRTFGNPDKWIDIAIANGLKAPYIDELGERINLISNASGNQINIAKLDIDSKLNIDKLSVGQLVLLQSNTQTFPEQRSILNIKQIPISGEILIELSGDPNLSNYTLLDSAYIRIYKQGTINSSFYILIPSDEKLDDTSVSEIPWFLKASDTTERRQKVDMLLGNNGDLVFDSTGDIQLSYGLDNAIQAIKLKMSIELGELRRHSDYGLIALVGSTNHNINDLKNTLTKSITSSIEADQRFAGIDRLDIVYSNTLSGLNATSFSITLVVRLAGSSQLVPISFSVNV